MPYQIAFAYSKECEKELIKKGFKKTEVYIKSFSGTKPNSDIACKEGDSDFFRMESTPYQFITTSWWGAGN